jgi:hypothetical protein
MRENAEFILPAQGFPAPLGETVLNDYLWGCMLIATIDRKKAFQGAER